MADTPELPGLEGEEPDESPRLPIGAVPPGQLEVPEDPFSKEQVEFMVGDQAVAVRLRGGPVGEREVPTGVAGPFMYRLHLLVQALASTVAGRQPGRRGKLPEVPGAGLLTFVGLEWGHSATFHLGVGGGEEYRIAPDSTEFSLTTAALAILTELLERSARGSADELYEATRELNQRVLVSYAKLIDVVVQNDVETLWHLAGEDRAIELTVTRARRTKAQLELPLQERFAELEVSGVLYRADARDEQFRLDLDGLDEDIYVEYAEYLHDEIRRAWDRHVVVKVRAVSRYLARQIEPENVSYELIEIVAIDE